MASNSIAFVFLLLPLLILFPVILSQQKNSIPTIILGSVISPRTHHQISWPSPSGKFEFDFYAYGTGFAIGIWLVDNNNNNKSTVVWTANPDDPPVASNAVLVFNQNGLLLIEAEQERLISYSSSLTTSASMLDSGNFVLYNNDSKIAWLSFEHPTVTILGGQVLWAGDQLVSSLSETNCSKGRFQLSMQSDGDLVLYTANNIHNTSKVEYWSSGTYWSEQLQVWPFS